MYQQIAMCGPYLDPDLNKLFKNTVIYERIGNLNTFGYFVISKNYSFFSDKILI